MPGVLMIVNIAGAVALLLWAVRMIRTGIERAFSRQLRSLLDRTTSRGVAVVVGAVMAIGLQGSTAVALLIASVAGAGLLAPSAGLFVLVGADLGSSLVVRILSLDVDAVIPFLMLAGVATFMIGQRSEVRQAARITIGLALVLLALELIHAAAEPLGESSFVRISMTYLSGDRLTAFAIAALVTWIMHSGVASVLVLSSLVTLGIVDQGPLSAAFALGANFGSGIAAVVLVRGHEPAGKAVPISNLAIRAALALACLAVLDVPAVSDLTRSVGIVDLHVAFNVGVVALGLVVGKPVVGVVRRLLASGRTLETGENGFAQRPILDPDAVSQPRQAIANALREMLRMSDMVASMIDGVIGALSTDDRETIRGIAAMDDDVDHTSTAVKRYLTRIPREQMTKEDERRCAQLLSFCTKLEQSADVVVRNLLPLAEKRRKREVEFSSRGRNELADLHDQVSSNLQLALNVLVSEDVVSARRLVERKTIVRDLERATFDGHMERLRNGAVSSIATSEIHLDAVRDLVQINTLVSTVAYPILERRGELLDSRLAPSDDD